MSERTMDPVHGVSYEFERQGEDLLVVDSWMEGGGGLPKHYHPVQEETWWVVEGEVRFHLAAEVTDHHHDVLGLHRRRGRHRVTEH